jgi:ATP-dependent Lon protease
VDSIAKAKSLTADEGFSLNELDTTAEILIPDDPLKRVIGQDEAVKLARVAARQRRHLLLVGPPGTGKSMIAQALSLHLPSVTEEIRVVHNPENPERPLVEVKRRDEVVADQSRLAGAEGDLIDPREAPINVAERLGYKCVQCGTYSSPTDRMCPKCNRPKTVPQAAAGNPFGDLFSGIFEVTFAQMGGRDRVTTTRNQFGKEEVVVYERAGEMIRVLDQKALEKRREMEKESPRKVLVPITRSPFVLSTGASETELLGDVRHDPYGGHPQLGTQPYDRVVPGSIHEAHEGVLFIDELPQLGHLQRYILTAMQEKRFPISGRNPQSAGASVKVDSVPCDFIFVGACNIQDLPHILSPLRSRITGGGYEVLVETTMPDSDANRAKLAQFVAQEIAIDKRIPPATRDAVRVVIEEAHRRAKALDSHEKALTLRLRELGGLIRSAGDIAVTEGSGVIEADHVKRAIKIARTIEEQIKERYGSYSAGVGTDMSAAQKEASPYHYWNVHEGDDVQGYQ